MRNSMAIAAMITAQEKMQENKMQVIRLYRSPFSKHCHVLQSLSLAEKDIQKSVQKNFQARLMVKKKKEARQPISHS